MGERDRRMKATDVFNEKDFFLGPATNFAKAFPEIEEIRVVVDEEGDGVWRYGRNMGRSTYSSHSLGEYVNCSNPRCYNGGFHIGQQIRFMVDQKEPANKFTFHCQGYEGSPKGRRKSGPCFNYFQVEVVIKYK